MIDDRITSLAAENQTLEEIAKSIFQDWFVDFTPVWRKVSGETPLLSDELLELFPSSFGLNDLPLGWKRAALKDCFSLTMGQSPPGST